MDETQFLDVVRAYRMAQTHWVVAAREANLARRANDEAREAEMRAKKRVDELKAAIDTMLTFAPEKG